MVSANGVIAEPTVEKTASPTNINVAGSGTNDITTVTIEVTGAGSATTTSVPMDVIFAIDSSGSMGSNDPAEDRLTAAKEFVDKMDSTKDTAGVVSWDSNIDFFESLSDDFSHIKDRIDDVDSSGGTNLDVGLTKSIELLDSNPRSGASAEVIIFLSDGQGTYYHSTAQDAADKGYTIYSIGLGGSAPDADLVDMANTTGGKFYSSPTAENLDDIYQDIYSEIAASTIPYNVDVVEITQDYIIDEGSFNIVPDNIVEDPVNGTTIITWLNIGAINDADPDMSADETVTLTFEAKCDRTGTRLPVDVVPDAKVYYDDSEGTDAGSVNIPQAYITVGENIPPNEEIPEFPTVAIPMIAIIGLAFIFSKRE
ncbi:VWA domain-containing protein [Methanolobus bombayensis]|uniref:VWA domain-containing protein n=1 Tax=Methanolobus bombayensis TaxID=38023 RepID=UPI001AE804DB|nr:VWA domain-containing protein [Methanolobus bombayensis]MBP1909297.1 Ca-activated chloride channel family protein [Methanolobus bombayensis]